MSSKDSKIKPTADSAGEPQAAAHSSGQDSVGDTSQDTKSNESRRKLLDTAQKLFSQKGLDGVSTRDIAREAQVNVSLISYYFNGKEGLYIAILEDFMQQNLGDYKAMVEDFDLANIDKDKFTNLTKAMINRMITKKLDHPFISQLVLREMLAGSTITKDFMEKSVGKMAEGMLRIFEEAKKRKFIKADIHAPTLLFSMAQAIDMYVLTSTRFEVVRKCGIALDQNKDEYANQIYKIFIEGALT